MQQPESSIIPEPSNPTVRTSDGVDVTYDYLVVAPGLETNFKGVSGLTDALADPAARVSSIYSAPTAEKTWRDIQAMKKGKAIFTQPAGPIKCAGAPQKVLWMALSQWVREGVRDDIDATFATGGAGTFFFPPPGGGGSVVGCGSHVRGAQVQRGPRDAAERAQRRGALPA